MFLCVSPNPAIDKRLTVSSLLRGHVNRARAVQGFPGGKSVHVAMVLHTLGGRPHWIGPCGGASGQELLAGLSALGIQATASTTRQPTRTNLEIVEDDATVTEILEPGAAPSSAEWEEFESACRRLFGEGSENAFVIFSGSLPPSAAPELYAGLVARAREFGCKTFLDTSGEPLRLALAEKPYFVKPNREEAAQLLGKPVSSLSDAISALRKLLTLGAQSAALSLGSEGLLFCAGTNAPVLFASVVPLQPRSTVGCGDSAMAGFVFGIASRFSPEDTVRLAAACGVANCSADSPGAARLKNIRDLQQKIFVRTLD
ncbi:MAG: 1-phosphofructokinase family hexose kinase [Candidatus Acidiferrum sp.]|jgi:1-phosphofructokinase family hexose kinase